MRQAGFQREDINKAQIESIKPESLESFTDRRVKNKGYTESSLKSRKKLDNESYDEYYDRLEKQDEILREATDAYVKKYGKGALIGTGAARAGEFLFQPARALRPEVTLKDISGAEWVIGSAQVALLVVSPLSGKLISGAAGQLTSKGIQLAAGGVFSSDTAKNWDEMNNTERAISLAMDTLIIGTALPGRQARALAKKGIKYAYQTETGGFRLDYSKPVINSLEQNGIKVSDNLRVDLNKSLKEIQSSVKFKDLKGIEAEARNLNRLADSIEDPASKKALKEYAQKLANNPKSAVELAKEAGKQPEQIKNSIKTVNDIQKNTELQRVTAKQKPQIQVKERPKVEDFPVKDLKKEAELKAAKDKALEDAIKLEKRKKEIIEELRKQKENVKVDPENPPTMEENIELRKKVQAEIVKRLEKRLQESLKKAIKEAKAKELELKKQSKLNNKAINGLENKIKVLPLNTEKQALQTELANLTALKNQLKEQTQTQTQTKLALQTKLQEQTKLANQVKTETKTQTQTKTVTQTKTIVPAPTSGKTGSPKKSETGSPKKSEKGKLIPGRQRKAILTLGERENKIKSEHTALDRANAVTWKQGLGYWIVYPDKSVEWSKDRPAGVKEVPGPDKNKPKATIQVLKPKAGSKIVEFGADLGIQDIKVRKQGKSILSIRFKQDTRQRTSNPVRLKLKPYHSERQGKIYRTRIGKGELLSRRPL